MKIEIWGLVVLSDLKSENSNISKTAKGIGDKGSEGRHNQRAERPWTRASVARETGAPFQHSKCH